jgi:drug/metabolite transporter (DMT)-like permease
MPSTELRRQPLLGVVYMLASVFAFSAMDAAAKGLAGRYPLVEIVVLSRLVSPFFAAGIALRQGGLRSLATRHPGWHVARSVANGVTLATFFAALVYLPLADTVAITFASPLIMCLLAVPFLGERVGWQRWSAIVVGFIGVLIIVQPTGVGFGLGALLALGAATGDALCIVITRRMSATETSHSMLFWSSILIFLAFGVLLPFQWVTPQGEDWLIIAVLAGSGSIAQFCLAQAFRYGEVSQLAPLQYTALIWAVLLGFVFWNELPGWAVLVGVTILIASSVGIARHEARAGKII